MAAQATQALSSFLLMAAAARTLSLGELGILSVLYGSLVLCAAITSGFVGDSLTVLDRHQHAVRAGLQGWMMLLAGGCALAAPVVALASGLVTGWQAVLFGGAVWGYLVEDVLRRLLMARLFFIRIVLVDAAVLSVTVGIVLVAGALEPLTINVFLAAIVAGQLTGACLGVLLAGRGERYWVRLSGAAWRTVARYGAWRAAQQMLRPGLLTVMRLLIVALIALEASGEVEVARVYAAPAMLMVAGLSSYLFATFARRTEDSTALLLRRADKGVGLLMVVTVACGAVALAVLPFAGPLATGREPDTLAVAGWLAFAVAIAAVSPYGALAAVRSGSSRVFGIRLADTVLSLGVLWLVLDLTGNYALAPLAAAAGSLLGGAAIRFILLVPLRSREGTGAAPIPAAPNATTSAPAVKTTKKLETNA